MKDQTPDHRHLRGAPVKKRILNDAAAYVNCAGRVGKLVSVPIEDVPEAAVYVRNQARAVQKAGLPFE